jgi:endonuclease/exonuclease/phosphatase family metal-dependent hydrolase
MRRKKSKSTPSKFSILDKIMLGVNILAALLLLLSYWAPDTDPRENSFIAILGFCYPIILSLSILLGIFWIFKRAIFSLISIVCILLGYNTFFSYVQLNSSRNQSTDSSLRIMAYNIKQFKGIDKFENLPTQKQVFDIIIEANPKIILFEEFAINQLEPDSTISSLTKTLNFKHSFIRYFNTTKYSPTVIGNAIFSKYPIIDTGTIPSPKLLKTRSIYADIKYGGKTIRVYCLHLSAVTIQDNEKSRYLKGNVSVSSSSFIQRKLASAFVARSLQVSYIKKHIEKCPYPYVIAGDFNDTPNSYSVNEIGYGLKNAFIEKGQGFETTYYSSYPLHIDHIFASQEFNIVGYQSINEKISDHKPVIADIQLNK